MPVPVSQVIGRVSRPRMPAAVVAILVLAAVAGCGRSDKARLVAEPETPVLPAAPALTPDAKSKVSICAPLVLLTVVRLARFKSSIVKGPRGILM